MWPSMSLTTLSVRLYLQHLTVTVLDCDDNYDNFTDWRYQPSYRYRIGLRKFSNDSGASRGLSDIRHTLTTCVCSTKCTCFPAFCWPKLSLLFLLNLKFLTNRVTDRQREGRQSAMRNAPLWGGTYNKVRMPLSYLWLTTLTTRRYYCVVLISLCCKGRTARRWIHDVAVWTYYFYTHQYISNRPCSEIANLRQCVQREPKLIRYIYRLIRSQIRMSAGSLYKYCGFITLSASVISQSVVKIGR